MRHGIFGMLHSRGLWISELLLNEVRGSGGLAGSSFARAGSIACHRLLQGLLFGRARGIAEEFTRQLLLSQPQRSFWAGSGVGYLGAVVIAVSNALGDSLQRNPASLTPWIPVPRLARLSSECRP